MDWKIFARSIVVITEKNMRIYYFKGPVVVFGLLSDKAIYARSLGININLWWGLALLAFGGFMLAMAWRAARAHDVSKAKPSSTIVLPTQKGV